ncbi:MAG: WXG100 family type VII secretion target [Lachnospiraceae bacterium]|nr:WXG100 family type VII secretion target [Lachnospiraceae bacterium]
MGDVNIQVDAAKLRLLAESIDKVEKGLKDSCYSAKAQIDSLKNVWTGDAATSYQTGFQKLMDACNESLNTLAKIVNSMYDTADRYDRTFQNVQSSVKDIPKLPTNFLK